jgi:hypothetical protein
MAHAYLSTACYHSKHGVLCRQTCKYCDAPCSCTCHRGILPVPWVDQARAVAAELFSAIYPADVPAALAQRIETDPALFWLRGEVAPDGQWHEPGDDG